MWHEFLQRLLNNILEKTKPRIVVEVDPDEVDVEEEEEEMKNFDDDAVDKYSMFVKITKISDSINTPTYALDIEYLYDTDLQHYIISYRSSTAANYTLFKMVKFREKIIFTPLILDKYHIRIQAINTDCEEEARFDFHYDFV